MVASLTPSGIDQLRQQYESRLVGSYQDHLAVERMLQTVESLGESWGDQGVPTDTQELPDAEVLPICFGGGLPPECDAGARQPSPERGEAICRMEPCETHTSPADVGTGAACLNAAALT